MFGERLKRLRNEKKLTQQDLAKLLKISPSTVGMYEQGRRDPDTDTLKFLADYFNVSVDYLLGRTNNPNPPKENRVLNRVINFLKDETSTHGQYLKSLKQEKDTDNLDINDIETIWPIDNNTLIPIPILGVIRAGEPIYAKQNIEGYEWVSADEVSGGEYFYLRVTGDSMKDSRIYDGDLVYVRRQPDVENGEIAVVMVDKENATLKRVYKSDGFIILRPDNPEYEPKVVNNEDARIIGKVIHVKFDPHLKK